MTSVRARALLQRAVEAGLLSNGDYLIGAAGASILSSLVRELLLSSVYGHIQPASCTEREQLIQSRKETQNDPNLLELVRDSVKLPQGTQCASTTPEARQT
ncbi:hypothetical protein XENOCAPTIV_005784, partial [Xenoophorus captivus]